MHLDLAAIDARKEILTQVRGKGEREQGKADEPRDQLDAIAQTKLKQAAIAAADRFELTLEALLMSDVGAATDGAAPASVFVTCSSSSTRPWVR
jgi:hypothetical protein